MKMLSLIILYELSDWHLLNFSLPFNIFFSFLFFFYQHPPQDFPLLDFQYFPVFYSVIISHLEYLSLPLYKSVKIWSIL